MKKKIRQYKLQLMEYNVELRMLSSKHLAFMSKLNYFP